MRLGLNLYPPFLFHRIRVLRFGEDFRSCRVRVARSLLTRNLNGTTFGGTIFSAFDPIWPVLYWQVFARRGEMLQVWLKGGRIRYRKPAATALTIDFHLADEDVEAAARGLERDGRVIRVHEARALDREGDACAIMESEVYMRHLREGQREVSGF